MSTAPTAWVGSAGGPTPYLETPLTDRVWRAPLVPVALAFSAGILLDRFCSLPLAGSLFAAVVMLAAWTATLRGRSPGLPLVYMALAVAAIGSAYHHFRCDTVSADDISHLVDADPKLVELRGFLDAEPVVQRPEADPLRSFEREGPNAGSTMSVLRVSEYRLRGEWMPVSGRAQLLVAGVLPNLHTGDEVEVVGRLQEPEGPANPGERDFASELREQGIRAVLRVQKGPDGVTRLEMGGTWSPGAWRARVRGWGVRALQQAMPERQSGLAAALLLGEGSLLGRREWDRYIRTGVIHVLVVSGQHLVVLGGFIWLCLRFAQVRQRRGVLVVIVLLWVYAFLTGMRPSVLRATLTVSVFGGGLLVRRPVIAANALALAWLLVLLLDPADVNDIGCLLSFLCVAGLYWDHGRQLATHADVDPLDRLLDEARPAWQRWLLGLGQVVLAHYLVTLGLWLVVTPLVAARLHFVPLTGLLIGPPVVLLTSLALVAGFLYLLASLLLGPLAVLFAWPVRLCLSACDWLVELGDGLRTRHGYVSDVPGWWVWGFYLLLGAGLLLERSRRLWRWALLVGLAWLCVGLLAGAASFRPDELRVTFLAVGHGGCTVIETPDGRTLLYDAGSLRGPDVVRRQIAPFLWQRGIRRIDEVFLSHADLDHFNGVRDLLDRFAIGQITCTPSFDEKNNAAVRHILAVIEKHKVPVRRVWRGDRLDAGEVEIEVLHPPEKGPEGIENVRSLVLHVRHGRQALLLTGDLESVGLDQVLRRPLKGRIDVLMAPHHGSRRIGNLPGLMSWARPQVVVACQERPRSRADSKNPYESNGARFLGTWPHGAVSIRSHASGMVVETFATKERFVVRPGKRVEK
ncbi:MAG: ComEC/Rec2 family competence protein [Planctomycetes bacterium]|nr:ComEC/Rec2 family competence protein [Planctomycetota bacterium]